MTAVPVFDRIIELWLVNLMNHVEKNIPNLGEDNKLKKAPNVQPNQQWPRAKSKISKLIMTNTKLNGVYLSNVTHPLA